MSPSSTKLDEAPAITASGVRRSCEIDASKVLRTRSVPAATVSAVCAATWQRPRSINSEITSATVSMMANVNRYWMSSTVKVPAGGTNVKSNAATLSAAQTIAAPREKHSAITTTASRYTIAILTTSKRGAIARPVRVQNTTATAAQT